MTFASILKLVHVFTAFWFISGIIARQVTLSKAMQSRDIQSVCALLSVSSIFERGMVIPGSMAVLAGGIMTAWMEGWPILGFIQGGTSNWVLASLVLFFTIIPIIRFVFLPRGKVFEAALTGAVAKNQVTPDLYAAFRDPVVHAAHVYEFVLMALIVCLMVLKPF